MLHRQVALLRGINVGRAKRIAMADLRALVECLGYVDVRTLQNSGNLVFAAEGPTTDAAAQIEAAIGERLGISTRATVLTAEELAVVVEENPLLDGAEDHSRLLVAFLMHAADRSKLTVLARLDWAPEAIALGACVAYLWCPGGVLASRLHAAIVQTLDNAVTVRNWSTTTRLQALSKASV